MSFVRPSSVLLAALAFLSLAATFAAARPLLPAERRDLPYSGIVRACDDPMATGYIQGAFAAREGEYWHSGLAIVGFDEIREVGFRSNGLDYIPRRYCRAHALMNDQKIRTVTYFIEEDGGSIGYTDNVVWCVAGLDRENTFAPGCQMALP